MRPRCLLLLASVLLLGSLGASLSSSVAQAVRGATVNPTAKPPWVYGRADARFTLIEYADLECPYCRAYFPVLRRWIDSNPDVNWQWHALPLSIHEPAATAEERIAECAGESGGKAGFWHMVDWIYSHTRGDGGGLPPGTEAPDTSSAFQTCLNSRSPDAFIREQVDDAAREEIAATPTLRLIDHRSHSTLMLYGPAGPSILSSAVDFLAALPHDSGKLLSQ